MYRRVSLFAFSLIVGCSGGDFDLAFPDDAGDAGAGGDTGTQPDSSLDAGPDGEPDSSPDAGPDGSGGSDASDSDAGDAGPDVDAGPDGPDGSGGSDAGPDGSDAGGPDAGDAGSDAGDGGLLCVPATKKCSGLIPQTCDVSGTSWVSGAACPFACVAGACTPCEPGKMKCVGSTPQLCDGTGNWTSKPACSGGTPICLSGFCYECTPGDDRCTGVGPNPKYDVCGGGGTWSSTVCTFGCTVGVGCTGTCVPGTKKCGTALVVISGITTTVGTISTCQPDGSWNTPWECKVLPLLKCDPITFTCGP